MLLFGSVQILAQFTCSGEPAKIPDEVNHPTSESNTEIVVRWQVLLTILKTMFHKIEQNILDANAGKWLS